MTCSILAQHLCLLKNSVDKYKLDTKYYNYLSSSVPLKVIGSRIKLFLSIELRSRRRGKKFNCCELVWSFLVEVDGRSYIALNWHGSLKLKRRNLHYCGTGLELFSRMKLQAWGRLIFEPFLSCSFELGRIFKKSCCC